MSNHRKTIVSIFAAGLLAGFGISAFAQQERAPTTIQGKIAKAAQLTEGQANRFWDALGKVVVDELGQGKVVNVPGLGDFRVIRQPSYRDFNRTRPVTVDAYNTIAFRADQSAATATNAAGTLPAEVNDTMGYDLLRNTIPSLKTQGTKTPTIRTGGN